MAGRRLGIVFSALLLAGGPAAAAAAAERHDGADIEQAVPERPARDFVWRAALAALRERGFAEASVSREDGRAVTGFLPLEPDAADSAVGPDEPRPDTGWQDAEYRYLIGIGDAGRVRLSVRAEIRASAPAGTKRALRSNHRLEREFLQAFADALRRLGEE